MLFRDKVWVTATLMARRRTVWKTWQKCWRSENRQYLKYVATFALAGFFFLFCPFPCCQVVLILALALILELILNSIKYSLAFRCSGILNYNNQISSGNFQSGSLLNGYFWFWFWNQYKCRKLKNYSASILKTCLKSLCEIMSAIG